MHTLLLVFCDRIACLLCAIVFVPSPIACTHPVDVAGDQRHCYFFELFVHLYVSAWMEAFTTDWLSTLLLFKDFCALTHNHFHLDEMLNNV